MTTKQYNHCNLAPSPELPSYPSVSIVSIMALPVTKEGRAKNSADADDIAKIMRANRVIIDLKVLTGSMDDVICHYRNFLCDCLLATPRLIKPIIVEAALATCKDISKSEAELFANFMVQAVSYARLKSKSTSSGSKLHPAVLEVVRVLNKTGNQSVGQSLIAKAKSLQEEDLQEVSPKRKGPSEDCEPVSKISRVVPSGSSSSSSSSYNAVMALYMMPIPTSRSHLLPPCIHEVASSQEDLLSQSPPRLTRSAKHYQQYVDGAQGCIVRVRSDGELQKATMTPGPVGFLLADFDGEIVQSEIPNIMLEVMKKPAAAPRCVAEEEGEDEEKEEEEEEKDEEEEEDEEKETDAEVPEEKGEEDEKEKNEETSTKKKKKNFLELESSPKLKANYTFQAPAFGKVYAEFYSKKSYLRYLDDENKKRLLVILDEKQHSNHQDILEQLVSHARMPGMTKERLVQLKFQMSRA